MQLGFGLGIRVVCAGQGLRISRGLGAWLKLKSPIRSPRMAAFSRTSVLGLLRHLAAAGLLTLGDQGYHGAVTGTKVGAFVTFGCCAAAAPCAM